MKWIKKRRLIMDEEFHCVYCGHVFESIEDSGTHECPGLKVAEDER